MAGKKDEAAQGKAMELISAGAGLREAAEGAGGSRKRGEPMRGTMGRTMAARTMMVRIKRTMGIRMIGWSFKEEVPLVRTPMDGRFGRRRGWRRRRGGSRRRRRGLRIEDGGL